MRKETASVEAEDRGTAGTAEVAAGVAPEDAALPEAAGATEPVPEVAEATRVAVFCHQTRQLRNLVRMKNGRTTAVVTTVAPVGVPLTTVKKEAAMRVSPGVAA